jgi:hypothetical protein
MFNPSRDQARRFLVDAWRKHCGRGEVVSPLEDQAARIVALHPEYHALIEAADALTREWTAESGEANPFLHLSLHLAVEEQLSIDQPFGIRAAFELLLAKTGDRHAALHAMLECLGETLWRAQRSGQGLDSAAYVECLRRQAGSG